MNNEDWAKVKTDTRVKLKYHNRWATGTVTIVNETEAKVLFDGEYDLNYWYYKKDDLELL